VTADGILWERHFSATSFRKAPLVTRTGLAVARFSAAAWVGAAALFVVTAVREVTYPGFDSLTKDELALLRFPAYYAFGFVLVGLAFLSAVWAGCMERESRRRNSLAAGLLGIALLLMGGDFVAVYSPMAKIITPPGQAHAAEFRSYHRASVWINVAHVGICAVAAMLLCWPARRADIAGRSFVE
jgi:hypothetical protein